MVQDAAAHAEDDRKAHEMVDARNQCDAMVHSIKKALAEHGDKLDAEEKAKIETAIKEAEEVLKDGDKAAIEAKTEALAKASQKLGEKVYGDAQAAGGPGAAGAGGAGAGGHAGGGEAKKDEGDVVDAEFTEVKDKKA
jgi:molecular chaperone DnaK